MEQMTPEKWATLTEKQKSDYFNAWARLNKADREKLAYTGNLTKQLKGLEGWRVEVVDEEGGGPRRFIVGKSTGWAPIHLELARRDSSGGCGALKEYAKVKLLYRARKD